MKARQWCCHCMERWSSCVFALGLFGMAGFVGSFALIAAGWVGVSGYLTLAAASLTAYSVCLLVGHLGDALELRRRYPSSEERLPLRAAPIAPPSFDDEPARIPLPLGWRGELSTLRNVRTRVGHA